MVSGDLINEPQRTRRAQRQWCLQDPGRSWIELWNRSTGEMLGHFGKMIDKWARLLNIQKLPSIKPSGREYHLITLMGLREAGERHHDPQWRLRCLRKRLGTV